MSETEVEEVKNVSVTDTEKRINLKKFKDEISQRSAKVDELNNNIEKNEKELKKLNSDEIKEMNKIKKIIDKYLVDKHNKYNKDLKKFKRFRQVSTFNFCLSVLLLIFTLLIILGATSQYITILNLAMTILFSLTTWYIMKELKNFKCIEMLDLLKSHFDFFRNTLVSLCVILTAILNLIFKISPDDGSSINDLPWNDFRLLYFIFFTALLPVVFILFSGLADIQMKQINLEKFIKRNK